MTALLAALTLLTAAYTAVHSIAADGTLSPSWVCPIEDCTWHEFARLVGWEVMKNE